MSRTPANILGLVALIFWSMTVGVTRHVAEANIFGMPALAFLTAGGLLVLFDLARGRDWPWKADADPKFWLYGGGTFIAHITLCVSSLAWSDSRTVVLVLGLVNYLWPALILVLLPLFPCRVKLILLVAGLAMCLSGVSIAFLWGMDVKEAWRGFLDNWPAFAMMAAAAFFWGFYSNAARKWAGKANGTGLFQLATGVVFLLLWAGRGGELGFTSAMTVSFLLYAVMVNAVAYMCWDFGVRHGDLGFLGAAANFLPLGSVLFGGWYLGRGATPGLWLGGLMVCAGAILSRRALVAVANESESGR